MRGCCVSDDGGCPKPRTRHSVVVRHRIVMLMTTVVMVVALVGCGHSAASGQSSSGAYCGAPGGLLHRPTKVVVIIGENESRDKLVGAGVAPFQQGVLGKQCGSLSNMHGLTHGSEPNYLGLVAGGYPRWALCDYRPDDQGHGCPYAPSGHLDGPSLFSQLQDRYGTSGWRSYEQSMRTPCQKTDGHWYHGDDGTSHPAYVTRHNPAVFFGQLTSCRRYDVPAGSLRGHSGAFSTAAASGRLPKFSLLIPDDVHNGHDTSVRNYDDFLSRTLAFLRTTTDYQSGALEIIVTYDEGTVGKGTHAVLGEDCMHPTPATSTPSCEVSSFVVGRYVPHLSDSRFESHYSILKTIEAWAGLAPLGHAADPETNALDPRFMLTKS